MLSRQRVLSLAGLEAGSGPYAAVLVAAGAACGAIMEIGKYMPGGWHQQCRMCLL